MNLDKDLDLDIKNYSINDIENFFGLDTNSKYSANDIEHREYEIRTKLLNGGDCNVKFKRTFVEFISTAKQRLINHRIIPNMVQQPITIPINAYQLDAPQFSPKFSIKVDNQYLSREPEVVAHQMIIDNQTLLREPEVVAHSMKVDNLYLSREPELVPHQMIVDNQTLSREPEVVAHQMIIDNQYLSREPEVVAHPIKVDNQTVSRDPELLTHPETPYIYSNPSEFFQGELNPLNTRVLNKSLTIDTKFRENIDMSTSSDFIVQLPTKLLRVVSLQLTSIEFPVCFYGISSSYGNNFLNLTVEYYSSGGDSMFTNYVFIIPDGNYTSQGLIAKINELISSNVSGEASIFSQVVFSLSDIDGHVTVKSSSDGSPRVISFQLDFSRNIQGELDKSYPLTARLGWNLGFIKELYTGAELYVSEALIDPSSIRYVFLSVEDYNNNVNNSFVTAFSKSIFDSNILARITINKEYFKVITNTESNLVTEPRQYFGPVDITRLHIRLYDDHGRILNMNNMNYSFGLTFKQIYNL